MASVTSHAFADGDLDYVANLNLVRNDIGVLVGEANAKGTMSLQNANSVNITGGSITGITFTSLNVKTGAKTTASNQGQGFFGSADVSNPFGLSMYYKGDATLANRYVSFQTQDQGLTSGGNLVIQESAGKVLIRSNSSIDSSVLQVTGDTTINQGSLFVYSGSGAYGAFEGTTNTNCYSAFKYSGSHIGYIGNAVSLFSTGANTDFAIRSEGTLYLGSGSTTYKAKLLSTGRFEFPQSIDGYLKDDPNDLAYKVGNQHGFTQTNLIGHMYDSTLSKDAAVIKVPSTSANSAYLRLYNNGQLGLNCPVQDWYTGYNAIHFADAQSSLMGFSPGSGLGVISLVTNSVYDTSAQWKRTFTGFRPTLFQQQDGNFYFYAAGAGSSGSVFSYTLLARIKETGIITCTTPSLGSDTNEVATTEWVKDQGYIGSGGLGSMASQNSNSVSITGGSITGITDLAVADGGTGSSTASGARTNLGLVIGTDVQAQNANLSALAGVTSAANNLPYFTGSGTAAVTTLSSFGRTLIDDASALDARATLGCGDMAAQNSSAVNITGGTIIGPSLYLTFGSVPKGTDDVTVPDTAWVRNVGINYEDTLIYTTTTALSTTQLGNLVVFEGGSGQTITLPTGVTGGQAITFANFGSASVTVAAGGSASIKSSSAAATSTVSVAQNATATFIYHISSTTWYRIDN